jgi:hypothetical protein
MPVMSSVPLAGGASAFYPFAAMTGGSGKSGDPRRNERLRAALRDNLKRRKAQLKARAQAAVEAPPAVRPRESGNPGAKKS